MLWILYHAMANLSTLFPLLFPQVLGLSSPPSQIVGLLTSLNVGLWLTVWPRLAFLTVPGALLIVESVFFIGFVCSAGRGISIPPTFAGTGSVLCVLGGYL